MSLMPTSFDRGRMFAAKGVSWCGSGCIRQAAVLDRAERLLEEAIGLRHEAPDSSDGTWPVLTVPG
ncbi:hypothetical protein ABZ128_15225 [Streptomyces sp. NPDC006326]|uniref:hypothetical protein n=1 Tax=Streptomyces sp. NPDC006326 TaxID=3156752 RepID=UPI0033B30713